MVVAGGPPPDPRITALVPHGSFVVAADSGADHALALGLRVDHLIGDLDSVSAIGRAAVAESGAEIERHPVAKDATDLELALGAAVALGPQRVLVIGGAGGDLDHELGALLLLAAPWFAPSTIQAWQGSTLVTVVRAGTSATVRGAVGSRVSLLPIAGMGGMAKGITTVGLRYPLHDEDLPIGTSRGLRNELTTDIGSVIARAGTLLVVQVDALEHALDVASRVTRTSFPEASP